MSLILGIAVSWSTLDLPRPVTNIEAEHEHKRIVAEQQKLRSTVLNDIQRRLRRNLNEIKQMIWKQRQTDSEVPEWMLREQSDIEQQMDEIDRDLRKMSAEEG